MANRQLRNTEYTVGWICALPIELAAVSKLLDEKHENLPRDRNDDNSYTFGRMGEHNVVIACLPDGVIGTNPAATVSTQLKLKFPSVDLRVMVGIGGGVPSAEDDIRLGDVVISKPEAQHGGVVQYDMGKTEPGERFVRTGCLDKPPKTLLNVLSRLEANRMMGESKWLAHLDNFTDLPKFSYQGTSNDVLYKASHEHTIGSTCERCGLDETVAREPRETSAPEFHLGTIASGNQVIKDGITRDRLSSDLGKVLCFEMEAAGLMNSFPCLVVRGICDYADSHKNNKWQPYAAAAAAACAKEILGLIPGTDLDRRMGAVSLREPTVITCPALPPSRIEYTPATTRTNVQTHKKKNIRIAIKFKGGKVMFVDATSTDTIGTLKSIVGMKKGFHTDSFVLTQRQEYLEDERSLSSYRITQGTATFVCVMLDR